MEFLTSTQQTSFKGVAWLSNGLSTWTTPSAMSASTTPQSPGPQQGARPSGGQALAPIAPSASAVMSKPTGLWKKEARAKTSYSFAASQQPPGTPEPLQSPSAPKPAPTVRDLRRGNNYSTYEREAKGLTGLLPTKIESLSEQVARCLDQVRGFATDLERYSYLNKLRNENPHVHYQLVLSNLTEFLPLLYTPTVGEACQKFDKIWQGPEGMYITAKDRGNIRKILDNWTKPVDLIVVSDGSRILGLGDLGANGMGIPVGKLSVYTAAAGFHPDRTLPILLDTGCNTESIRESPHYLGCKHPRIPDSEYYPLVDEFLMAVKDKWPSCLLQFEDFSNDHCFELLERYRKRMRAFNDDIQGTGAVIAAGFLNAAKLSGVPLNRQRIVFYGAGSAGVGVADTIKSVMVANGMTAEEASKCFYLVDTKGLVTTTRGDELAVHKRPYARSDMGSTQLKTLDAIVEHVKPTALIGLSGTPGVFNKDILGKMGSYHKQPIIFALSNPTKKSECSAEDAYKHTQGRAIFASGSPFKPVTMNGKTLIPGQGNNMYIFPGLGLGVFLCQASEVSDGMVTASAQALAEAVSEKQMEAGCLYPSIDALREISVIVAVRVIQQAQKEGLATKDLPSNLHEFVREHMWEPIYKRN